MRLFLTALLLLTTVFVNEARAESAAARAERYFREVEEMCARDNGSLWGVKLAGPILLVDTVTRAIYANQADANGRLKREGGIYTGTLPQDQPIANTSVEWSGVKWAMIMWPLPEERRTRLQLVAHELFHRVQERLKLTANNPENQHLDKLEGRIWLRLEWRALEHAVYEEGEARRRALTDALMFRAQRRSLFPESATTEDLLELNEGLAEYTGMKVSARTPGELTASVIYNLRQGHFRPSYVRSFAYITGPAYGYLLDSTGRDWRKQLLADDKKRPLTELLSQAFGVKATGEAAARAEQYDGDEIFAAENQRDTRRRELTTKYRAQLVDGPVLTLPITDNLKYSFNPNTLASLDGVGTVYPTLSASDDWGVLTVTDGALLTRAGDQISGIRVAARHTVNGRIIEGQGWKLELNEGWTIVPGTRAGDLTLRK